MVQPKYTEEGGGEGRGGGGRKGGGRTGGEENTSAGRSDKMKTENCPLVLEILEVTGELDKYVFVGVVEI